MPPAPRSVPRSIDSLALEPDEAGFELGHYVDILQRRKIFILIVALLVLVAALGRYAIAPRRYRAVTTLQVEQRELAGLNSMLQTDEVGRTTTAYHQTQYELLRSRGLAERVVLRLDLEHHLQFADERAARSDPGWLKRWLTRSSAAPASAQAEAVGLARLADRLLRRIEVEPLPRTYLVNLSYEARDPEFSAQVVNAMADAYIEWGLESRYKTAAIARSFLSRQIAELKQEIGRREQELAALGSPETVFDSKSNVAEQRVGVLNQSYAQAVHSRIQAEAHLGELLDAPAERTADSLSDGLVSQLTKELIELESDYSQNLGTYGPNWASMVELKTKIEDKRAQREKLIAEMVDKARSGARSTYETALRSEERLAAEIKRLTEELRGSSTAELENLKAELENRRGLLDELLRRQSETEVASRLQESRESNVRVVDRAVPPPAPASPRLVTHLVMGLGGGLGLAITLAFLVELLDRRLRSAEEVERTLRLPTLAVIPDLSSRKNTPGYGYSSEATGQTRPRRAELAPHEHPQAPISEAYRGLRTALLLSRVDRTQLVTVTSPQVSEGKTTTTVNLAICFAQLGKRVLLVDADLRRPRLHGVLGLSNKQGLVSYLTGSVEADETLRATDVENLYACTSGPLPPRPSELLASRRMNEYLEFARANFDFVFIDTPPVLVVTDATVLGAQCDGVVLCLNAQGSRRDEALACVARLRRDDVPLLGVVLNRHREGYSSYRSYVAYEAPPEARPASGQSRPASLP